MGVWRVILTMHVLYTAVWQVIGLSGKVKDAPWPGARFVKHVEPNSTASMADLSPLPGYFKCVTTYYLPNTCPVCGDGFCKCSDTQADCAYNYGKLTYIPAFSTNISWLGFANNDLVTIPEDFFLNVPHLMYLDLSSNGLRHIAAGAFDILHQLTTLRLTRNKLSLNTLAPVLSITTLEKLELSNNALGSLPDGIFNTYRQLKNLCITYTDLSNVNMTVFTPMENLIQLELSNNQLASGTLHTTYLPHLLYLMLSENSFTSYIDTCRNGRSLFPNLTYLDLSGNRGWDKLRPDSLCLPRLQFLVLLYTSFSPMHVCISNGTFNEDLFPEIRRIVLSPYRPVWGPVLTVDKHAFTNPTLELLYIAGVDFSLETVDVDCFAGCPNLKTLVLDHSYFRDVDERKFNHLFSQIPRLTSLSLTSTGISRVTARMFRNLTSLLALGLNSNRLSVIPDGVFNAMTHLTILDLSMNSISMVSESTFSVDLRHHLKYLSVSNNSFQCSCELMWFHHWLTTKPAVFNDTFKYFNHPMNTYTCDNLPNTTVQSFSMADQACLWSPDVSKFIIATIIILMFPLALGTALYRYRWHIRLVLYEAYVGRGDRWRRLQELHFRYDVFVCYDSEDLSWIREHLVPELEGRLGLRLCIHERDFTPGVPIVRNIEESVEDSKKVMMIFSKNFARSQWCQFDLQLSLSHVMENDDTLLVVLLEDIHSRDLTPAMIAVMKTMTYIEWDDDPEARASFWGRMRLALNEVLPVV